jgi:hypothetical protein
MQEKGFKRPAGKTGRGACEELQSAKAIVSVLPFDQFVRNRYYVANSKPSNRCAGEVPTRE